MQIYSDITNIQIRISGSSQAPALGSAIFGAVEAGTKNGGYDSIFEASEVMGKLQDIVYTPNAENSKTYSKIYAEYELLHNYFGKGANDAMKRLKEIEKQALL
jgi:L-ribulokinase